MDKFIEAYKIVLEAIDISGNRIYDGLLTAYANNHYQWLGSSRANANALARLFAPSPLGNDAKDALVLYYASRPFIKFPKNAEEIWKNTIDKIEKDKNINISNFGGNPKSYIIEKYLSDEDIKKYFPNFANICMSNMKPDTLRKMQEYIQALSLKQARQESGNNSLYKPVLPNNEFYRSLNKLFPGKRFAIMEGIDPALKADLDNPVKVLPELKDVAEHIPLTSSKSDVKYAFNYKNYWIAVYVKNKSDFTTKVYTIVYN